MPFVGPEPAEPVVAGPIAPAGDERRAPVDLFLGEVQAEDALDEAVGVVGLDATPPQCLGEHRIVGDEASTDLVHQVVGVADHHGDQRLEAGEQRFLFGRPDGTEDEFGVDHLLQFHEGLGAGHRVEVAHEFPEGGRVVAEGAGVPGEEVGEGSAHVRHAEHGVVHCLVEAHPQPQVVGREVPLAAEVGHVRCDHEE